ncbi:hypothetical protein P3T36_004013 [Kitasatospora sp. MAP12-15]|uniref:DUF3592 domain-containing protein n=1 Tax=unclassified Kitasatospora TaxID=2633591 RepID=UPI0024755635|nr:DUF3592 domain-containing protein [Kitasatospora sp. MAP12-44]MDH6115094.1 hypothetical protein [Kitasatospora sp. MAP12-44]
MTTPQDSVPRADSRDRFTEGLAWSAEGTLRLFAVGATLAVLVGTGVAAWTGWGSGAWWDGWWTAGAGAALGVAAAALRLLLAARRGDERGGYWATLVVFTLLTWFAAGSAYLFGSWLDAYDLDGHATARVTATVIHCRTDVDNDTQCTYHWTMDDRTYYSTGYASTAWPDGHLTHVRIDPAHPGHPAVVGGRYWATWIGIVICGLLTLGLLVAWLITELNLS